MKGVCWLFYLLAFIFRRQPPRTTFNGSFGTLGLIAQHLFAAAHRCSVTLWPCGDGDGKGKMGDRSRFACLKRKHPKSIGCGNHASNCLRYCIGRAVVRSPLFLLLGIFLFSGSLVLLLCVRAWQGIRTIMIMVKIKASCSAHHGTRTYFPTEVAWDRLADRQ